jgi:hypothetical protein
VSPAERAIGLLAGLIGIAAGVAALLEPQAADWLWPVPAVVILSLALLGSWIFFFLRSRKPRSDDQQRLDEMLALLNRKAINELGQRDYALSWPLSIMQPVRAFQERDLPERRFHDKRLEERRQQLHKAAAALDIAMGANSWIANGAALTEDPKMNIGWSHGELDVLTGDDYDRAATRLTVIRGAAWGFVELHDDLVEVARRAGYDLTALQAAA